jgi:segregation and condensation protein B
MTEVTMDNEMQPILHIESAIEAILFAAGYPVRYDKIAEVLGIGISETKHLIENMAETFQSETSPRGLRLLMFPDTCQLCTKEQYLPYIREALGIRRGGNLSASSMEVLAVIAYAQPVTRSYIDTVRGVDSSYAVNALLDKELIEACGRLDAPGRPMLYATTEKFLRVFGMTSLADLPQTELPKPMPESGEEPAENTAQNNLSNEEKDPPSSHD